MSFEKISDEYRNKYRSCLIIVNYDSKELNKVKNLCRFIGIKELIILTGRAGNSTIKDILNGAVDNEEKVLNTEKAMVFNNTPAAKVSALLDNLKKIKINRPLTSMVTKTSLDWKLSELIGNMKEEKLALSNGETFEHK